MVERGSLPLPNNPSSTLGLRPRISARISGSKTNSWLRRWWYCDGEAIQTERLVSKVTNDVKTFCYCCCCVTVMNGLMEFAGVDKAARSKMGVWKMQEWGAHRPLSLSPKPTTVSWYHMWADLTYSRWLSTCLEHIFHRHLTTPALSTPALSTSATWCRTVHSCFVHSRKFSVPDMNELRYIDSAVDKIDARDRVHLCSWHSVTWSSCMDNANCLASFAYWRATPPNCCMAPQSAIAKVHRDSAVQRWYNAITWFNARPITDATNHTNIEEQNQLKKSNNYSSGAWYWQPVYFWLIWHRIGVGDIVFFVNFVNNCLY